MCETERERVCERVCVSATYRSVQHGGDEVVSDALHLVMGLIGLVELVWFGQNGAFGVHTYNLRIHIHTLRCLEKGKQSSHRNVWNIPD